MVDQFKDGAHRIKADTFPTEAISQVSVIVQQQPLQKSLTQLMYLKLQTPFYFFFNVNKFHDKSTNNEQVQLTNVLSASKPFVQWAALCSTWTTDLSGNSQCFHHQHSCCCFLSKTKQLSLGDEPEVHRLSDRDNRSEQQSAVTNTTGWPTHTLQH